eukprot:TRINITY_DN17905_c0_g1_i1.p1 TRINITY_DN17905_c0_g1~~TRINITY_DN17905_c0_g1_i1.p1  ORF type:complete len:181 (+),score=18.34 TRINITY_DN17905_c0_g1_i1:161-703(+)
MARAALLVACKAEETPIKVRDIINSTYYVLDQTKPLKLDNCYSMLREDLLRKEQILLRALNFNLTVQHPFKHILNYVHSVHGTEGLAQIAWDLNNETYLNAELCLDVKPELRACAVIALAAHFIGCPALVTQARVKWWEIWDVSHSDMCRVALQFLATLSKLRSIAFPVALEIYNDVFKS